MLSNQEDQKKNQVLQESKTVAVVGLSDNPERASYRIANYLQKQGYRIIPVNPKLETVLGEKAYPDLKSIPFPVDVVDVFRRQEEVDAVIEEALAKNPRAIWLQVGLSSSAGQVKADQQDCAFIENCCIMVEHRRLIG